jgi:GNAT superfamily N-acetyltransferase
MNAYRIRPARVGDAQNLMSIIERELGYSASLALVEKNLKAALGRDDYLVIVAELEASGEAIGYAHCETYLTLYSPPVGNLLALAVASDYQGTGAGTALLRATEDWLRSRGLTGLRISSGSQRVKAHGFYESRGYAKEKMSYRFMKRF